jgi:hypothetical protein
MKFIDGETVNKGIWECLKQAGSLSRLADTLEPAGVGRSTARGALYKTSVGGKLLAVCLDKFKVDKRDFDKTVTVYMTEEEGN